MIGLTEKNFCSYAPRNTVDMRNSGDCCQIPDTGSCDQFPVAMAYVRWQRLDRTYQPEMALERGTLFPELDKPFAGCTVTGGRK